MTGAKLLGMHETVTSPKEYRSRHVPSGMWRCWRRAGELCGRRGGLKPSGHPPAKDRGFSVAIAHSGYTGDGWKGQTFQGTAKSLAQSAAATGYLRIGRLQAAIPGESPKVDCNVPAAGR